LVREAAQSRDAGFTLVEALVSTLLMSIILAMLATITAQWLPSWNDGFSRLQRIQLLAVALDRLTDDLAAAQFISVGPDNSPPLFYGDDSSVTFVRTTLAPNADSGLQVVRIAETSDDTGPALVRSTAPLPIGTGQATDADTFDFVNPVVLIRSPYRVSFSYAGPDRLWRNDWHNQLVLPRAVRIEIRDDATSALLTASTSTRVYAELPASCARTGNISNCAVAGAPASSTAPPASLGDAVNGLQGVLPFGGAINGAQ
jgi:general secretion pathway protein J